MGEDVAGCAAGSVVVFQEGTAERSEALGALSSGVSSKGASLDGPYPSPGYASSTPLSTACFSFSFCLPSGPPTDRPLKATPKPFRESSLSPLKGTEGTGTSGSGPPVGLGAGAGLGGASDGAVVSDAFPWGAWPGDAAADTHKQAGRQSTALTRASSCSCHVTKRFRILATLKQGNKSMYSNISGYVHMGLGLD